MHLEKRATNKNITLLIFLKKKYLIWITLDKILKNVDCLPYPFSLTVSFFVVVVVVLIPSNTYSRQPRL